MRVRKGPMLAVALALAACGATEPTRRDVTLEGEALARVAAAGRYASPRRSFAVALPFEPGAKPAVREVSEQSEELAGATYESVVIGPAAGDPSVFQALVLTVPRGVGSPEGWVAQAERVSRALLDAAVAEKGGDVELLQRRSRRVGYAPALVAVWEHHHARTGLPETDRWAFCALDVAGHRTLLVAALPASLPERPSPEEIAEGRWERFERWVASLRLAGGR